VSEISFLFVVHRDQFVSKWQTALAPYFGSSLKEGLPPPFAHLYVYYNAISRQDIGRKTRIFRETVAKKYFEFRFLKHNETGSSCWLAVQRKWFLFTIGVKLNYMFPCNPATVLNALDLDDAKFFRSLNFIEAQLLICENKNRTRSLSQIIWSKIRSHFLPVENFENDLVTSGHMFAPKEFVSELLRLRQFLSRSLSDSCLDLMLAIFIAENLDEFACSSSDAFLSEIQRSLFAFKMACRAMISFEKMLEHKDASSKQTFSLMSITERLFLGSDARVFRLMSSTSTKELIQILQLCGFENVDGEDLDAITIDQLVDLKVKSVDIEGGVRNLLGVKTNAPEPKDLKIYRPKIVASAKYRDGQVEKNSTAFDSSSRTVPTSEFFQQESVSSFRSRKKLNGFHGVFATSGDRYVGDFQDGLRSGFGKYEWKCGDTYEGLWKNDERNGFGVLSCNTGNVYKGEWLQGRRSGRGIMMIIDGSSYEGEWFNDSFCGKGEFRFSDGRVLKGIWPDCLLEEECDVNMSTESDATAHLEPQYRDEINPYRFKSVVTKNQSAKKLNATATFSDLLFGHCQSDHLISSSIVAERLSIFESHSNPNVDFGQQMVSKIISMHQGSSSKASYSMAQVQIKCEQLNSLRMEILYLESRNEAFRAKLMQLVPTLTNFDDECVVSNNANDHYLVKTEGNLPVVTSEQSDLILELTKQVEIMTVENDALVRELSQTDFDANFNVADEAYKSWLVLKQQADSVAVSISSIRVDVATTRDENAALTHQCKLVAEQNRSFECSLKIRSDLLKPT
jgi:hypothetical protein